MNIKGYKYKYTDKYISGFFYRCIFRKSCKLTILISNEDYKKILDKDIEINKISYIINSNQKNHTCTVQQKENIDTKSILTKSDEYELAVLLIRKNIDKKNISQILKKIIYYEIKVK